MVPKLQLQDIYSVLVRDINKLPQKNPLSGSSLSSELTKNLSPKYTGMSCFFEETDHEHTFNYFLSNIEALNFRMNEKGLSIDAKINRKGRYETGSNDKIFYTLVKNEISRNNLDKMINSEEQKLGSKGWQKSPIVHIMPREVGALDDFLFLIKDGKKFYKHTF